jgi:hypothetical protein
MNHIAPTPPAPTDDDKTTLYARPGVLVVEDSLPSAAGRRRPRRWRLLVVLGAALGFACLVPLPAHGSWFGEENVTLAGMLTQLVGMSRTMKEISDWSSKLVDYSQEFITDYKRVNAGIDVLKNYNFDSFAADFKNDVYHQYPGLAKLELASKNFSHWDDTHVSSPFTAYQAITAVVGDASRPLREDIAAGRVNIDQELILASEASGGFAAAHTTEDASERFDRDLEKLARLSRTASPAQAQQIAAQATLTIAAQNSYLLRLLSHSVRLDSVDATLQYAGRLQAKNSAYENRDLTVAFGKQALEPPTLIRFEEP